MRAPLNSVSVFFNSHVVTSSALANFLIKTLAVSPSSTSSPSVESRLPTGYCIRLLPK
ncbi:hypothetical protein C9890_0453 [Perkinsus sp. BL_2016]|nr:hypothetical protein C9890_0453 [Perkinsus sp. BL_2016]